MKMPSLRALPTPHSSAPPSSSTRVLAGASHQAQVTPSLAP